MVLEAVLFAAVPTVIIMIPFSFLVYFYRRTNLLDYLILALVYLFTAFLFIAAAIIQVSENGIVLLNQIIFISANTTFYLLFIHSLRIRSRKMNRPKLVIGSVWYGLLVIMLFLWTELPSQPESYELLGLNILQSYDPYGKDAGLVIGSVYLYTSAFRLISDLFSLFVFVHIIWMYSRVQLVASNPRTIFARRVWIVGLSFFLLSVICVFPGVNQFLEGIIGTFPISETFQLMGLLVASYIALRVPETLLISHAQVLRVIDLYEEVTKQESKEFEDPSYGLEFIVNFLLSLPRSLFKKE